MSLNLFLNLNLLLLAVFDELCRAAIPLVNIHVTGKDALVAGFDLVVSAIESLLIPFHPKRINQSIKSTAGAPIFILIPAVRSAGSEVNNIHHCRSILARIRWFFIQAANQFLREFHREWLTIARWTCIQIFAIKQLAVGQDSVLFINAQFV